MRIVVVVVAGLMTLGLAAFGIVAAQKATKPTLASMQTAADVALRSGRAAHDAGRRDHAPPFRRPGLADRRRTGRTRRARFAGADARRR